MAGRGRNKKLLHAQISDKKKTKTESEKRIEINRAPVLTLWVAVVAEREGYSFQEGLSFGKLIAGIFAHSKGRRLGIYEEDEQDKEQRKRKRKQAEKICVFGMKIAAHTIKEGSRLAMQNNKPISPASVESYLRRAFGPHYEQAKEALQGLTRAYPPKQIGSEAYSLYEKIRPQVQGGIRGWGAKGYLDLDLVEQLQSEAENALTT
ncbi:hypothetical protein SUGI_0585970 [Cryptomeria japonica]|uniref:uncharacterized protein LOC131079411 n=1 Tax=Cryptomeria japonica TaxID=3369 RepID=UPI002414825E|nr:uncharacterized protein LOC131079411 [Cryptomeria japonica]GLJ29706.1 hypothetical protein SUGI_0585970 [Cryptomeria japonica]